MADAERDAVAVEPSIAEPMSAAGTNGSDAPAVVEYVTARDNVDARHHGPFISNDKLSMEHNDSHGGASSGLLPSGGRTAAVAKEGAVGTEATGTAAATENAAAADEAAGQAAADDTALVVVPAMADPESLVDFPFNSRRGEPGAAPCSASVTLHTSAGSATSHGAAPVSRLSFKC